VAAPAAAHLKMIAIWDQTALTVETLKQRSQRGWKIALAQLTDGAIGLLVNHDWGITLAGAFT
jgi:hypothetical protein